MQKIIKILFLLFPIAALAAIPTNNDYFSASIVNRTGSVIRFMPNDNGVWIALTHGNDSHLFWETVPSVKVKLQGLAYESVYVNICPELKFINSGETISILVRNPDIERQFYCEVEPAVY